MPVMNVTAPPFFVSENWSETSRMNGSARAARGTRGAPPATYTRTRIAKPSTNRKDLYLGRMSETRSQAWEKGGLAGQVSRHMVRRARRQAALLLLMLLLMLLLAGVLSH